MNQIEIDENKGTELFINRLVNLNEGDLAILRSHSGLELDKSLQGFDLFTGIWWPIREKGWAPKRRVSWLITKLFARFPFKQYSKYTLAKQLGYYMLQNSDLKHRIQTRFDQILLAPFDQLEPNLNWALDLIRKNSKGVIKFDWVSLTNDLMYWERESTKIKWVNEFLNK